MMMPITLRVPYPSAADAGDRLQIYTDFGTGTVDHAKPLLARPIELFPGETKRFAGHGTEAYGQSRYGIGRASPPKGPGHGAERYGSTPHGSVPRSIDLVVEVPPAFGTHKFEVELQDSEGNAQGGSLPQLAAMVSGTRPPTLSSFAYDSYDDVNDLIQFTFTRNTE